jgi:peptidoglycan/xylan/chitin deacetylase (PgdA/CDA1 family)
VLRRLSTPLFFAVILLTSGCIHLMLSGSGAIQPSSSVPGLDLHPGTSSAMDRRGTGGEESDGGPAPSGAGVAAPLAVQLELGQSRRELTYAGPGREAGEAPAAATPIPRMSASLPVLMYHYVNPHGGQSADPFARDLTVSPALFESQLRYLNRAGFRSVGIADLASYLQGHGAMPPKPVILTFDDGYGDHFKHAFPLLKRHGFSGTFFIITGLVGHGGYLTWSHLREMADAGMEVGSHTVSHPDLAHLDARAQERELAESREALETELGRSARVLSYPSGAYDPQVAAAASRAGYVAAVTTKHGVTHERSKLMELPRVRIRGEDPLEVFVWRLENLFPSGTPLMR